MAKIIHNSKTIIRARERHGTLGADKGLNCEAVSPGPGTALIHERIPPGHRQRPGRQIARLPSTNLKSALEDH